MSEPKDVTPEEVQEICEHCELEAQFWEETTEIIYAYMVSEYGDLAELDLEQQKKIYGDTMAKIAESLGMEAIEPEARECLN